MGAVEDAKAAAEAAGLNYFDWAERQRKTQELRTYMGRDAADDYIKSQVRTQQDRAVYVLDQYISTELANMDDAAREVKDIFTTVNRNTQDTLAQTADEAKATQERASEAAAGPVNDLGEAVKEAFREFVIDPAQNFLADAISSSVGDLLDKSIMGDVSKGTEMGELLSASMPEVVKAGSPKIRQNFTHALNTIIDETRPSGIEAAVKAAGAKSTVSPETGAAAQGVIAAGSLGGLVALTAAGSAIEAATLGQVEIPGQFLLRLGAYYGLSTMAAAPVRAPYEWGVSRPAEYFWAKTFTPNIPGPTDLVRFELREVYRPEFRDELLTPRPTDKFLEQMAYQGYDKFQAENYWAAHWELPGTRQGYEMFQRLRPGKAGISKAFTEEDLRALLRRLDILPRYHDQLIDVAFRTLSRVDVRRMYRVGTLDRAGVLSAYLDLGYSAQNAELMTDFTVKYESRDEEIDYGKSELINMFKEGYIVEAEFKSRAASQQHAENDIERALGIAKLRFEYDLKNDQRAVVITAYRKEKISRDEATAQLLRIMPAALRVTTLLDREDAKKKAEA